MKIELDIPKQELIPNCVYEACEWFRTHTKNSSQRISFVADTSSGEVRAYLEIEPRVWSEPISQPQGRNVVRSRVHRAKL